MALSRFHAEKRNYKRLLMNCPVSFQLTGSPNQKMGTCLDLSANGILLQCDDTFPIGAKINVQVSSELSTSSSFSATMEVVRVERLPARAGFKVGGILEGVH